ncbi:conjugal transfer protein TraF [Photobacterium leiognathi]|uniref:conjugal transfer protein TraF n=1 Tax=Photobacterium leiognathi TaxID=553611 RepID=UPI0034E95E5D
MPIPLSRSNNQTFYTPALALNQSIKRHPKNRQSLLTKEIGDKAGIFFFFRSDCPFCHKQMPLIALLEKNFGFTIKPVSLDGKPLPDSP